LEGVRLQSFGSVRRDASRLEEKGETEQVRYDESLVRPRSTWLTVDSQDEYWTLIDYSSQYLIVEKMQEGM
jgi:hypothetical protein